MHFFPPPEYVRKSARLTQIYSKNNHSFLAVTLTSAVSRCRMNGFWKDFSSFAAANNDWLSKVVAFAQFRSFLYSTTAEQVVSTRRKSSNPQYDSFGESKLKHMSEWVSEWVSECDSKVHKTYVLLHNARYWIVYVYMKREEKEEKSNRLQGETSIRIVQKAPLIISTDIRASRLYVVTTWVKP